MPSLVVCRIELCCLCCSSEVPDPLCRALLVSPNRHYNSRHIGDPSLLWLSTAAFTER